ncbi:MAG TPA: hypothetical protein PK250_10415 [Syntrophobacter fumaroxidans]|nr:hypothetical protein [Syntrophobacter fumaroxidans]
MIKAMDMWTVPTIKSERRGMKRLIAAVFIPMLLAVGCAPVEWVKPGATHAEFERDRIACERESGLTSSGALRPFEESRNTGMSMKHIGLNEQKFEMCMKARGWRKTAD